MVAVTSTLVAAGAALIIFGHPLAAFVCAFWAGVGAVICFREDR